MTKASSLPLDGVRLELRQVDQYARLAPVVDLKHADRTPLSLPVDHPWRCYAKKLNGKLTKVFGQSPFVFGFVHHAIFEKLSFNCGYNP